MDKSAPTPANGGKQGGILAGRVFMNSYARKTWLRGSDLGQFAGYADKGNGKKSCSASFFVQAFCAHQIVRGQLYPSLVSRSNYCRPVIGRDASFAPPFRCEVHGNRHVTRKLRSAGPQRNKVAKCHAVNSSRIVYELQDRSRVVSGV